MKKLMLVPLMAVLCVGLSACQGDERIGEVSKKETEGQIEVENKVARTMEQDLTSRQKFYQGVAGVYEGEANAESGALYKIRIRLSSSLPAYTPTDRTRMREEIASDLNNLFFNAQILLWSPESKIGAIGCRATDIRPDLNEGTITIASPDCPNFYTIRIHDQGLISGKVQGASEENGQRIARALITGKVSRVEAIYGEIQPTSSSDMLTFNAQRASVKKQ